LLSVPNLTFLVIVDVEFCCVRKDMIAFVDFMWKDTLLSPKTWSEFYFIFEVLIGVTGVFLTKKKSVAINAWF